MRLLPLLIISILLAACSTAVADAPTPTVDPTPTQEPAPTDEPTPTEEPIPTEPATLTLGDFGVADGPGESVSHAIANAGDEPRLVNGTLLKGIDGDVWLCEAITEASPPECDGPRLFIPNYPEDVVVADGETYYSVFARDQPIETNLQEADGVRWIEDQQVFGVVRP
jgi:hypothetical protein